MNKNFVVKSVTAGPRGAIKRRLIAFETLASYLQRGGKIRRTRTAA